MDDIVNSVPSWMFTAIIAVCILFIIGIIFARLYRRASAEQAFVRTGLGGQKVVMSGGAIVMPIFHEIIPINMNTLKLEVSRSTIDSLITKDRMRVDVVVAFFVRVKPSVEGIATAAQTLGQRTLSPEDLRMLVEDKFVDALRATAAQMTMHELQDTRENFVQGVQNTVAEDLSKNGLELESVSLTNFNQTSKEHFNPNNAFDAEGLTKLTQETERRRRERNEVEQDVEVAVREKNRDALSRKLEIEQQEAFMTLEQEQQVKTRTAEQNARIAAFEAERRREAEAQRALNDAINVLSDEQTSLKFKLALLQALPAVIEKSVEPMKSIDGIKIIQVDGLNRGSAAGDANTGNVGGGNLAEQALSAALSYRTQAPLIDSLLNEIGVSGGSLAALTSPLTSTTPVAENVE
ncbi:TPA: flotillin family protein [Escherichia coli]|uniref:flotillin family protein n=1 Tax=Escherichia coli TaxID=562 RepID=UPI001244F622|nr:flotillin family protein [Escherichia coli]KAB1168153.1 flotillin family protein [Escherichia coli]HAH9263713.1 flotillin family protein [Escherichia coli]HAV8166151.1 flotillin family protein [Escherichia coli]HAW7248830.1 flotillin family protein [Escherichia coli]